MRYDFRKVATLPSQFTPGTIYYVDSEGIVVIADTANKISVYGGVVDAKIANGTLTLAKSRGSLDALEYIEVPLVGQGGYTYRLVPEPHQMSGSGSRREVWKIEGYTVAMNNASRFRLAIMRQYKKGGLWSVPMFGAIRAAAGVNMPGAWPLGSTYFVIDSDRIPIERLRAIGGELPHSYHYRKGVAIFEFDATTNKWIRKSNIAYIETTYRAVPLAELLRKSGLSVKTYTKETAPYMSGTTII